ncbi:MAG: hypothetical protein A2275_00505 [Bacteroidetes bacterium RIFOXYA12_FULL_35_11]|nr:MAG: hypothetical protein A2X01_08855 [Bacteroidetes bacterium GWF2_35_48]OFY72979.1 MAG: hypothetical protein A2275_00505 [Bacteroidetes bacterium RIFOXYA12_FULL_35_11]OFY92539.1 MAG: hypothetical protein A2491_12640 [Bacteroidetes bacterium RIFOXYC12_FULL_35_7]HBX51837.1 nuclear pore complex subunit [Bacteroidales bacterium]
MEALLIEATEDSPKIALDAANNLFQISGRSLPENAIGFYQPVFDWLQNYLQSPNTESVFEFQLEYFNTASAKQIAKILLFLEKLSIKSDVIVKWYYKQDDVDMLASGQRYAKLINVKFEVLEN